eukprot:TRINITY_DN18224_c0_g3_i1.p1 TRINITY_DN18224_c0_g3~~TRINITY_DN18224_c0_g3_i1.p1  ORF type:complete len:105 (+),score=36.43 TRINITY_DN18224_c0_g3_i1:84-398(+)
MTVGKLTAELAAQTVHKQSARRQEVIQLYRQILRLLKVWPSVKRARIRLEARRMFRVSSTLTDAADIDEAIQMAKNGKQVLTDQCQLQYKGPGTSMHYSYKGPF